MQEYGDLELGIHRRNNGYYSVELRFTPPQSDADIRLLTDGSAKLVFDAAQLRSLEYDSAAYGAYLSGALFADASLLAAFAQARSATQLLDVPLRIRLFIGPSAPELQTIRWETLRDPADGAMLLTSQRMLFSRYLSSSDWGTIKLRPKSELRALVMIANPHNLAQYKLTPIDVSGETARVKSELGAIGCSVLASGGTANLNRMAEELRHGYDILYLVCHGAFVQGETRLWLEDKSGKAAVVSGNDLVARLVELDTRPRLVVLVSCQSAGDGELRTTDPRALATLGPRLAEAGVPAVVAMQGKISMNSVADFMPGFFRTLMSTGQIDLAMAAARGAIRDSLDSWMPVLFMRLRSGRIWYVPGFGDQKGFGRWPALLRAVLDGRCTPILGFGLVEPLIGSSREIARSWAETYHYPLAPHERDGLPQVSQFLAVNQSPNFPRAELEQHVRREILRRYSDAVPATMQNAALSEIMEVVNRVRQQSDPAEPHAVLAQLPLPIYITTNVDLLLESALLAAGKRPQVALCPWNEYVERLQPLDDYRPTPQTPLVYHLFGSINNPDSLVLTEDDYFDYLIGVTSNKDLIPDVVRRALADTAMLFLGFQIDDWNFRVFFRSIMSQEGRRRRSRYAHVAVQIDPEEERIIEPEGARRYLETYFQDADMSLYWGRASDFIQELHVLLSAQAKQP
jgi:hypothetical protein